MTEVLAHPGGRVALPDEGLLGDLLLRVEGEQVAVPARLVVQVAAQRGEESPGGIQLGERSGTGIWYCWAERSWLSQRTSWKSRSPPGVSLTFGSMW